MLGGPMNLGLKSNLLFVPMYTYMPNFNFLRFFVLFLGENHRHFAFFWGGLKLKSSGFQTFPIGFTIRSTTMQNFKSLAYLEVP